MAIAEAGGVDAVALGIKESLLLTGPLPGRRPEPGQPRGPGPPPSRRSTPRLSLLGGPGRGRQVGPRRWRPSGSPPEMTWTRRGPASDGRIMARISGLVSRAMAGDEQERGRDRGRREGLPQGIRALASPKSSRLAGERAAPPIMRPSTRRRRIKPGRRPTSDRPQLSGPTHRVGPPSLPARSGTSPPAPSPHPVGRVLRPHLPFCARHFDGD